MTNEDESAQTEQSLQLDAFLRLRGILKDVYAEYGGGEAYLRKGRESFGASDKGE
jgi:hypothetical protein